MSKLYPGTYSPFVHNYNDIRNLYKYMRAVEKCTGKSLQQSDWDDVRRSCRTVYRRKFMDPLGKPLTKAWRTRFDDDGEGGTDYCIVPEDPEHPMTDEEIAQYLYDSPVYCGRVRSPYDCSGERFTWSWSYTHTPSGVALIHRWGIDI